MTSIAPNAYDFQPISVDYLKQNYFGGIKDQKFVPSEFNGFLQVTSSTRPEFPALQALSTYLQVSGQNFIEINPSSMRSNYDPVWTLDGIAARSGNPKMLESSDLAAPTSVYGPTGYPTAGGINSTLGQFGSLLQQLLNSNSPQAKQLGLVLVLLISQALGRTR